MQRYEVEYTVTIKGTLEYRTNEDVDFVEGLAKLDIASEVREAIRCDDYELELKTWEVHRESADK